MPINPELTDDSTDDTTNDNAQKNQISSGQSVNAGASGGTGSNPSSGGSSTSSQAGGSTSKQSDPTSSGSFTNLNQYVNANADQASGLGNKISQNVQGSANTGLSQLNSSANEFNTDTQAASVNPDDYSTSDIYNKAENVLNGSPSSSSGSTGNPTIKIDDPTAGNAPTLLGDTSGTTTPASQPLAAQSDIDAFNTARADNAAFTAGTDTAPKTLSALASYQTADTSLQNAEQNAQMTGTESGRNTLLQQAYGRPGYTQGETNLDQLLTQNVPSNQAMFANLQNNLLGQYGLANQEAGAATNADTERANAIAGTATAANNINTVLNGPVDPNNPQSGVLTQYANTLQGTPASLNAQQQQNITNAQSQITSQLQQQFGTATPFGIPIAQLASEIANPNSSVGAATIENSLSPDMLAKLNALNSLAGIAQNTLGTTTLGPEDTNLFNADITNNYTQADQQLQQQQNAFESDQKSQASQSINQVATPTMDALIQTYKGGADQDQLGGIQNFTQQYANQINTLGGEVNKLNAGRQQNGLPPLSISAQDLATARNQAINEIAYHIAKGDNGGLSGYDPNTNYSNVQGGLAGSGTAAQYISDRLNSTNSDGYGAAYAQMINQMATANAFNNLIQNVNNNPGYQVESATINQ